MTIITGGLLGPYLVTGGLAAARPAAPLLLTATLSARLIPTPAPASWTTIDPDRTQEMAPRYGT